MSPRRSDPGPSDLHRPIGQGIVEYGLILGLAAVFAVVVLVVFGGPLADVLAALGDAIDG
jgi:Flp pilus assembly pilin Flp